MASHSHIHTPMGAAAMQDATHPIRSNLGLSVSPKDTVTDEEEAPTLWSFGQPAVPQAHDDTVLLV